VPGSTGNLSVRLIKNPGWYSLPLTFGTDPALTLVALLNPPHPYSLITRDALDLLMKWELVDLTSQESHVLKGISIEGQSVPDFVVRIMPLTRLRPRWDIVIGSNFFDYYTDLHLHIPTSTATFVDV
jgi:hypothetical protein